MSDFVKPSLELTEQRERQVVVLVALISQRGERDPGERESAKYKELIKISPEREREKVKPFPGS